MTKTGEKFLERLAGVMLGECSRKHCRNIPVDSNYYKKTMNFYRKYSDNIIRNCYEKGLITENEAALELIEMPDRYVEF